MFPCPACGQDRRYREWNVVDEVAGGTFFYQGHECVNPLCTDDVARYCWMCGASTKGGHDCANQVGLNVVVTEDDIKADRTNIVRVRKNADDLDEKFSGVLDTKFGDIFPKKETTNAT